MKRLFMREEYIRWSLAGLKTATTRTRQLDMFSQYKLVSGNRFKPKDSGLVIRIDRILSWTPNDLSPACHALERQEILEAEHFESWGEFMSVLERLNKKKRITPDTQLHTHFYEVVK